MSRLESINHAHLHKVLEDFFSMNDLPDILDAINAVAASHILHTSKHETPHDTADRVFLAQRAAAFLVRLDAAWRHDKAQKEVSNG